MATTRQPYVYDVICGRASSYTHAIAALALPYDLELHSPLCGTHFKREPMVVHIGLVTCSKCSRRLEEMGGQGHEVRWAGLQEDADGTA